MRQPRQLEYASIEDTRNAIEDTKKQIARNKVINKTSRNNPVGKRSNPGIAEGIKFDSMSEYIFYAYTKYIEHKPIVRNLQDSFTYIFGGEEHKFFPDFKVSGKYFEVKGIFSDMDIAKQNYTSNLVTFVTTKEIAPMRKALNKDYPIWKQNYQLVTLKAGSWKHKYGHES